jgi:uncharacterized protein YjbI with pentapeptide repeats
MSHNRRQIPIAATASAAAASLSTQRRTKRKRVLQEELGEVIRLHSLWLADLNCGQRCMLGGRDLSGLQFGRLGGPPVNLSGADFTQADLSQLSRQVTQTAGRNRRKVFHERFKRRKTKPNP